MSPPPYATPSPPYAPALPATMFHLTKTEPGLDQPWYGINFGQAIKRAYRKGGIYTGRASRGEFWWFYLFLHLVYVGYILVAGPIGSQIEPVLIAATAILFIWGLATIIPFISLCVRRLHDNDTHGGVYCIVFLPALGWIILLIILALGPYRGPTRWDLPSAKPAGPWYDRYSHTHLGAYNPAIRQPNLSHQNNPGGAYSLPPNSTIPPSPMPPITPSGYSNA